MRDGGPSPSPAVGPTNAEIAGRLERIADLLEAQDANPFRVGAYLSAARTLRDRHAPVVRLLARDGVEGLIRLPHVGRSLAALIDEYARTGRIGLLDRLEGSISPESLLARVPGIGDVLAERIHDRLGVETLEELELAAWDGRLDAVPGFGERRVQAVRVALAGLLARRRPPARSAPGATETEDDRPPVDLLLDVDEEYRRRAEAGELRTIAPRRFNPAGRSWLPILHTERDDWHLTALYSNTARAHRLGRTHDWVVIYYERDGTEGQCTVVTEHRGALEGLRVVRGRESESAGT
jgi:hypothetical protein